MDCSGNPMNSIECLPNCVIIKVKLYLLLSIGMILSNLMNLDGLNRPIIRCLQADACRLLVPSFWYADMYHLCDTFQRHIESEAFTHE